MKLALDLQVCTEVVCLSLHAMTAFLLIELQEERVDIFNSTDEDMVLTGWRIKSLTGSQVRLESLNNKPTKPCLQNSAHYLSVSRSSSLCRSSLSQTGFLSLPAPP
jgi:hypothetical protein